MNQINPQEELAKASAIAQSCRLGQISYDEAKKLCQPHLDLINKRIEERAKKHGQKAFKKTFSSLLR